MERSRTLVVTGSASGIGAAARQRLEAAGHRVIGVDLHDADVLADLATVDGRQALVDEVGQLCGGVLDGVIACAGVASIAPAETIVRVNYFGARATLGGLRPLLAKGTAPRAAVISSTAALYPADARLVDACLAGDEDLAVAMCRDGDDRRQAYVCSKRAIARWVRQAAVSQEWAAQQIPLNAVGPGVIRSAMTRERLDDPDTRREMEASLPMPLRWPGVPDDVASLLCYLTSPENTLVTGQVVFVDGGFDALTRGDDRW